VRAKRFRALLQTLKTRTMKQFSVKTSNIKQEINNPHFYVLNKGLNSGKPLQVPCPNCFIIQSENEEFKEVLYWISFALWKSKAFHPFLMGSVIPFIRIGDYKHLIVEKIEVVEANPIKFAETIKQLSFIEMKEKQLKENLKLIQELKRAYVHQYFNKKK
jgi:hypothetical protein